MTINEDLLDAVGKNKKKIVLSLLNNGANLNFTDEHCYTALIVAAQDGYTEIVKILLEKGADPNSNKYGESVLIIAAQNNHPKIVKILLEKGADPDLQCINGETALMVAAEEGCIKIVSYLLEAEANPHLKNKNNDTAFMLANAKGHTKIASLLSRAEVDEKGQAETVSASNNNNRPSSNPRKREASCLGTNSTANKR